MQNNQQDEIEIDLLEIIFQLRRKIWIVLLSMTVTAALVGGATHFFITPMYSSTSKLYILTQSTSLTSLADIQIGTSLTKDYVELIQSRPVVEQVIENLNLNRTYEGVLEQITVTNPNSTRILVITVTDADPQLAKDMADEFANVSRTRIAGIMCTDEPSVVEMGYVNENPVSPNLMKNIILGALVGAFISAVIIVLFYMLDDTVKTTEDVEKYLDLNTLASIPDKEAETKKRKKK